MKNLSIKSKIIIALIVLGMASVVLGATAYLGIMNITQMGDEVQHNLIMTRFIREREIDHLDWSAELSAFIFTGSEFSGSLDHTACGLGQWYYNFTQSETFRLLPPSLQQKFRELEQPHIDLHTSAEVIVDVMAQGDQETAARVYEATTQTHLQEVRKIMTEINAEYGLLTESLQNSSQATQNTVTTLTLILIASVIFVALMAGFYLNRNAIQPIQRITAMLKDISEGEGDLTARLKTQSQDEVGRMAYYFNQFVEKIQHTVRDIHDTTATLKKASTNVGEVAEVMASNSEELNLKMEAVSTAVEEITVSIGGTAIASDEVRASLGVVSAAIEEMNATLRNMATASEQSSAGAQSVSVLVNEISAKIHNSSQSTDEVSSAVNSVVTAIKEINLSLNDVSQSCERSIQITANAEIKAQETNQTISQLDRLSAEIGKIINVINDIADQTNMLALNAAIEAAGAGEAGKGFAVVANEVKELAKQTGEATGEIRQQIENMQKSMGQAVSSVKEITDVINEITEITNSIAAAVTEQSATTGDISEAAISASQEVDAVNREMAVVAANAEDVARSVSEISGGVNELARSASEISDASNEVASNVDMVAQKVEEVARSSEEIAHGSNEIAENVVDVNVISADTANGAVETSRAAREMLNITDVLEKMVKQFKI